MYNPTATRYNLLTHLRILFKFLNFFGLTSITFKHSWRKFDRPTCRRRLTWILYTSVKCYSGALALNFILSSLWRYATTSTYTKLKSVEAQEETMSVLATYINIVSAFIYAVNYFRTQDRLLSIFNEALAIFKKLKTRTGSELFLSSKMAKFLIIKTVILTFILKYVIWISLLMLIRLGFFNIEYTLFPILNASMVFSYIYVQLTLLCFYEKMNEFMLTIDLAMEESELGKCLRGFMSISRRIHTFRQQLDGFATSVFMCTYIGLFHDIELLYLTLKIVFYSKYIPTYKDDLIPFNFRYFPACLSYTFDMFIISHLSDALKRVNDEFQAIVVKLSQSMPSLHRDVEMMLLRDNICSLGLRAFGHIRVNHHFSFDFTINTVLFFVITFLQFFAAEQIYTKHFRRTIVTRDYVHNL